MRNKLLIIGAIIGITISIIISITPDSRIIKKSTAQKAIKVALPALTTRDRIVDVFTVLSGGEFTVEEISPIESVPRTIGKSQRWQKVLVEMIGPPSHLQEITVIVTKDNPFNAVFLLSLIEIVLPDWNDGPKWLANNWDNANETKVTVTQDDIKITYWLIEDLNLAALSFEIEE